jgi:hypothetical protein
MHQTTDDDRAEVDTHLPIGRADDWGWLICAAGLSIAPHLRNHVVQHLRVLDVGAVLPIPVAA